MITSLPPLLTLIVITDTLFCYFEGVFVPRTQTEQSGFFFVFFDKSTNNSNSSRVDCMLRCTVVRQAPRLLCLTFLGLLVPNKWTKKKSFEQRLTLTKAWQPNEQNASQRLLGYLRSLFLTDVDQIRIGCVGLFCARHYQSRWVCRVASS